MPLATIGSTLRLMKPHAPLIASSAGLALLGGLVLAALRAQESPTTPSLPSPLAEAFSPEAWRQEKRIIDLHQHIEGIPERFERAIKIMDASGVGLGVVLGAGTVTPGPDGASDFEKVKAIADRDHPGRFVAHMILDYDGWDAPDWSARAVRQVERGHALGAAGLKEFKRLGLFLKDGQGHLLKVDDPKLDPVWKRCGELGMPVSIHVGDPKAFWEPFDATNERWEELKDHRNWWFGDPEKHPPRLEIVEALDRVIARHPGTTFVAVHFGNNPEDPDWVDRQLDARPNLMVDVAARIPELGRQDPEKLRALFTKHQDRILFATDFMVYSRLILGSAGDAERPTDEDGRTFYQKCWRWFETADRDWPHMTPIQGNWTISSLHLPPAVLRKIYFDNARKLLARSLPLPVARATRLTRDFAPDGVLSEPEWRKAAPLRLEYQTTDATAKPEISTTVRVLWSDAYLYLAYESPFTALTVFEPAQTEERLGLWDKDVVETFINAAPEHPGRYTEFQWAPNGERLDLKLDLPERDFPWSSGMESKVTVDETAKVWRVEARLPLKSLAERPPQPGTRWRINFFRCDKAHQALLAWSPSLSRTFHEPARFGWLEFAE